jgi:hypothetical protein
MGDGRKDYLQELHQTCARQDQDQDQDSPKRPNGSTKKISSLAPDIITAILNGKNPPQLAAKKLMRLTPQIPVDWAEQRKLLGFQQR